MHLLALRLQLPLKGALRILAAFEHLLELDAQLLLHAEALQRLLEPLLHRRRPVGPGGGAPQRRNLLAERFILLDDRRVPEQLLRALGADGRAAEQAGERAQAPFRPGAKARPVAPAEPRDEDVLADAMLAGRGQERRDAERRQQPAIPEARARLARGRGEAALCGMERRRESGRPAAVGLERADAALPARALRQGFDARCDAEGRRALQVQQGRLRVDRARKGVGRPPAADSAADERGGRGGAEDGGSRGFTGLGPGLEHQAHRARHEGEQRRFARAADADGPLHRSVRRALHAEGSADVCVLPRGRAHRLQERVEQGRSGADPHAEQEHAPALAAGRREKAEQLQGAQRPRNQAGRGVLLGRLRPGRNVGQGCRAALRNGEPHVLRRPRRRGQDAVHRVEHVRVEGRRRRRVREGDQCGRLVGAEDGLKERERARRQRVQHRRLRGRPSLRRRARAEQRERQRKEGIVRLQVRVQHCLARGEGPRVDAVRVPAQQEAAVHSREGLRCAGQRLGEDGQHLHRAARDPCGRGQVRRAVLRRREREEH